MMLSMMMLNLFETFDSQGKFYAYVKGNKIHPNCMGGGQDTPCDESLVKSARVRNINNPATIKQISLSDTALVIKITKVSIQNLKNNFCPIKI